MTKLLTLLAIFISLIGEVKASTLPYELELILDHLSTQIERPSKSLITSLNTIEDNLSYANKEEIYFLIKTDFFKHILTSETAELKAQKVNVNSNLISNIKNKLELNDIIYTSLSKFILQSAISDLKEYQQNNFLENYTRVSRADSAAYNKKLELEKVLKYISKWLDLGIRYTPQEFNALTTQVSEKYIDKLALKTKYFKFHSFHNREVQQTGLFSKWTKFLTPLTENQTDDESTESKLPSVLKENATINEEEASKAIDAIDLNENTPKWSPIND